MMQESKKEYASFRDLIWNLAFRENFSDLEKARYMLYMFFFVIKVLLDVNTKFVLTSW